MKSRVVAAATMCGVAISISSCGQPSSASVGGNEGRSQTATTKTPATVTSKTPNGGVTTVYTHADYSTLMRSVADGYRAADFVAIVSFGNATYVHNDRGIPLTYTVVHIESLLGGQHVVSAGSSFVLAQTGGLFDGVFTDVASDPVFREGDRAILFVKKVVTGRYVVVDGPYGRFDLDQSGRVTPFVDKVGLGKFGIGFHGTVDELKSALTAAQGA